MKTFKKTKIKKTDYVSCFCNEENYYFNTWVNGNKNHVLTHLRIFSAHKDNILYNKIISQFSHDEKLLKLIIIHNLFSPLFK